MAAPKWLTVECDRCEGTFVCTPAEFKKAGWREYGEKGKGWRLVLCESCVPNGKGAKDG